RTLRSSDGGVPEGDDEIDVLRDEFLRQRGRSLVPALGPNEQETNVTSIFPADRPHVAPERLGELIGVFRIRPQHPDHRQAALLRARRERPRGRAAKSQDELAAFHSITSSARPMSGSGTEMPSDLAVFILMISSSLVACWTASSAGFSPLRIRPV